MKIKSTHNRYRYSLILQVADKAQNILKTTKEWKELERVWTARTRSGLLWGNAKTEPKFELAHPEIKSKDDKFKSTEAYDERIKMIIKCDTRVDDEIFHNLCSRSYFKGLVMLHLVNNQKELTSKVKCILNEMGNLLVDSPFKDHLDKLQFDNFLKMEQDREFNEFDSMYLEYMKQRETRIGQLKLRQEEEERKRLEREQKERKIIEELKGNFF